MGKKTTKKMIDEEDEVDDVASISTRFRAAKEELQNRVKKVEAINAKLEEENKKLKEELAREQDKSKILGDENKKLKEELAQEKDGPRVRNEEGKSLTHQCTQFANFVEIVKEPPCVEVEKKPVEKKTSPKEPAKSKPKRSLFYFPGYCYKCNRYGHKFIHCKHHVTNPVTVKENYSVTKSCRRCYYCRDHGHIAVKCPKREEAKARSFNAYNHRRPRCYKCKGDGHIARNCHMTDLSLYIDQKIKEFMQQKASSSYVWKEKRRASDQGGDTSSCSGSE